MTYSDPTLLSLLTKTTARGIVDSYDIPSVHLRREKTGHRQEAGGHGGVKQRKCRLASVEVSWDFKAKICRKRGKRNRK